MHNRREDRRGAATLEFALVASVALPLLLSMLVGGLGVFRYQEVAYIAREASRWSSVHGTQYALDTGKPAATASDVYNQVIVPNATALDLSQLTYSVTWNSNNSPSSTATVNGAQVNVANTVTVTISYNWLSEAFFGQLTMSSTSVSVMCY